MMKLLRPALWATTLAISTVVLVSLAAPAQEIRFDDGRAPVGAHAQRVSLDSDRFTITGGKPDWIELRFNVEPGFHINSHVPHDETLIPTALKLTPSPRIQVVKDSYPPGLPMHLDVGAGATLSTYAGEFRIRLQVVADKGESSLTGTLHYQACDAASCYPPRDLPFTVTLSAH